MGMDVSGKKPSNKTGEYFRNNVWWWRPLWEYCEHVAPDLTSKVKYGYSNDGDGLGARDSKKLAKILQEHVASGQTEAYAKNRKAELDGLPLENCIHCHATGFRTDGVLGPGKQKCNGCGGTGKVKPWPTHYPFSVENVEEFARFVEASGGFEIC